MPLTFTVGVLLTAAFPELGVCSGITGSRGISLWLHSMAGALTSACCFSCASEGLKKWLFLLTVLPPHCVTYDLFESFSMQVPCFHERSLRNRWYPFWLLVQFQVLVTALPDDHGTTWLFFLFHLSFYAEFWTTWGRSRVTVWVLEYGFCGTWVSGLGLHLHLLSVCLCNLTGLTKGLYHRSRLSWTTASQPCARILLFHWPLVRAVT